MNILPTSGIASLAGTARAQAHGTDAERRSSSADAAGDPRVSEVAGIETGQKSQDRDADGRQLLEQRSDEAADGRDERARDERAEEATAEEASGTDPSGTDPSGTDPRDGAGTHIDFQV